MAKLYGTPGPRALWPSVARSRNLAGVSMGARLLFDRLISQADDQGRLEGDPILVRAACMPLDAEASLPMVRRWLNELEAAGKTASEPGLIVRYQADGQALIQLAKWWTYQSGQKRIYPSRWPKPAGWPDDRIKFTADPRTGKHGTKAGDDESDAPADGAGSGAPDGAADAPGDRAEDGAGPAPARAGFRAEAVAVALTDSPPPPAERGRRADGTNPRAAGTSPRQVGENPRANGTSERQEREAAKRAPVVPLQVAEPDDGLTEEEIERGVREYREKMRTASG